MIKPTTRAKTNENDTGQKVTLFIEDINYLISILDGYTEEYDLKYSTKYYETPRTGVLQELIDRYLNDQLSKIRSFEITCMGNTSGSVHISGRSYTVSIMNAEIKAKIEMFLKSKESKISFFPLRNTVYLITRDKFQNDRWAKLKTTALSIVASLATSILTYWLLFIVLGWTN